MTGDDDELLAKGREVQAQLWPGGPAPKAPRAEVPRRLTYFGEGAESAADRGHSQ